MRRLIFTVALLLLACSPLTAQYVRQGSIGEKKEQPPDTSNPFATIPIEQWANQRFIFMPRTRQFQRFGYDRFAIVKVDKKGKSSYDYSSASNLPYDKYVGRIAKVTTVSKVESEYSIRGQLQIELTVEDTGEKLIYRTIIEKRIKGMASITVLDAARRLYIGKTLWGVGSAVYTYDETTGETNFVSVKRYSPLKVMDVVASTEDNAPVRFILQTESGKQGYIDVTLSGTNTESFELSYYKFNDKFLTEDPRIKYPWGEETWSLIEQAQVRVGMTTAQVRMSLGTPANINTTETGSEFTEQWVYGTSRSSNRRFYYFKNGRLTTIQE